MNWNDIRYFLSVLDHGSLARAADHLDVNQSTVFRRIRELEKSLGATLFDRRHIGEYRLTTHGDECSATPRRREPRHTSPPDGESGTVGWRARRSPPRRTAPLTTPLATTLTTTLATTR